MEIHDGRMRIELRNDEARRPMIALMVGYEGTSRAEYFIRSGLSEPAIRELVSVLTDLLDTGSGGMSLELPAGVETEENPRRRRPPRPDSC